MELFPKSIFKIPIKILTGIFFIACCLLVNASSYASDCKPILTPNHPLLQGIEDGGEITFECGEGVAFINTDFTAIPGCPECPINQEVEMGDIRTPGDCPEDGYVEKMECWWTVKDDCGNESYYTIYIITVDNTPPVFTSVPPSKVIDCEDTPNFGTVEAEDLCSASIMITSSDSMEGNDCEKRYIRTWTATDDCGNTSTVSQVCTAIDNTAPTFTSVPSSKTIDCDEDPTMGMATATDNCNSVTITHMDSGAPNSCTGGTIIRTFTATDACGNKATAQQTLTVRPDEEAPSFTSVPADKTISCDEDPNMGMAMATDNCSGVTVTTSDSHNIDACNGGTVIRTFTATDACGNKVTAQQTVTVTADKTAPTFTSVPADKTIDCGDSSGMGNATATDDCSGATVTYEDAVASVLCGITTYTRTFTATDGCGNKATAVQTITQNPDITAPTFTSVPGDKTVSCGNVPNMVMATATDDCSSVEVSVSAVGGYDACDGGTVTRTFTATDGCGNTVTAQQTVTVLPDDTAPTFTSVPADKTIACSEDPNMGMATATDNCGEVTVTHSDTHDVDACNGGVIVRTFTATDACGNKVTAQQTLTVSADKTAPTFTFVPEDKTVDCNGDATPGMATATDDCGTVDIIYVDSPSFSVCPGGIIIRTFTATDACGNTAVATQKVTITADVTGPTFTFVPESATVSCSADMALGMATAVDDCSGEAQVAINDSGSVDPCNGGTITRVFVATDACGRVTTAEQVVTVLPDNTPPTFTSVPADKTMACGSDPDMGMAMATDDCGEVMVTYEDSGSMETCGDGAMVRTFTATDACGNTATAQQQINVADSTPPTFTSVPDDIMINCGEDMPDFGTATATDNCGGVTITTADSEEGGDCATGKKKIRTFTATDECGNKSIATQTIMYAPDNTPPDWTFFPPDMKITCGDPIELGMPTAEDDCSNPVTLTFMDEYNTDTTNCGNGYGYDIYRTWKATDACGNMTTSIQAAWIVTPDYVGGTPFAFVPESGDLVCNDKDELGAPICETPCGPVKLSTVDFIREEDCENGLSYTRVWTAVDGCGNEQIAYQALAIPRDRVSVFQNELLDKTMACGEAPAFDNPVCEDCPENKVVIVTHEDYESPDGCYAMRTWTAMDRCGNQESVSQTISLADSEGPSFTFVPENQEVACTEAINFAEARIDDNCTNATVEYADEITQVSGGIKVTRTWIAVDACGNESRISRSITQIDNTAPTFTAVPADKRVACGEAISFEEPTVNDLRTSVQMTFTDEVQTGDCGFIQVKRTWVATDDNGNEVKASSTITQGDFEAPKFSETPQDVYLACGDPVVFTELTATDDCGQVTLTYWDKVQEATAGTGRAITRHWTAIDDCGNETQTKQNLFYAADTEAPYFTKVPESQQVSCGTDATFGEVEVADDCSAVIVSFEDIRESGDCSTGYDVRRVWTATDAVGNRATASQSFTFSKDETAPEFTFVPADMEVTCASSIAFGTAEANDNCSNTYLSQDDEMFMDGTVQVHVRTWTALDDCGNEAFAKQTIRVSDNNNPTFTYVPDAQRFACGEAMEIPDAVATDDCGSVSITHEDEAITDDCTTGMAFRRIWTATDASGNVATTSREYAIPADEVAPVFATILEDKEINCGDANNFTTPEVSDDCSTVDLKFDDLETADGCETIVARTWIATDLCGNEAKTVQRVRIVDNVAPVINLPAQLSMTTEAYEAWELPTDNIQDDCSEIVLEVLTEEQLRDDQLIYIYEVTATDACGNATIHTTIITISDYDPHTTIMTPTTRGRRTRTQDSRSPNFVANGGATNRNANISSSTISMRLSPNPTRGQMDLYYTAEKSETTIVDIYDLLGRKVQTQRVANVKGVNKLNINVEELNAGTYFIQLMTDGRKQTKRFVKVGTR